MQLRPLYIDRIDCIVQRLTAAKRSWCTGGLLIQKASWSINAGSLISLSRLLHTIAMREYMPILNQKCAQSDFVGLTPQRIVRLSDVNFSFIQCMFTVLLIRGKLCIFFGAKR